jgi:hypothetical protein
VYHSDRFIPALNSSHALNTFFGTPFPTRTSTSKPTRLALATPARTDDMWRVSVFESPNELTGLRDQNRNQSSTSKGKTNYTYIYILSKFTVQLFTIDLQGFRGQRILSFLLRPCLFWWWDFFLLLSSSSSSSSF